MRLAITTAAFVAASFAVLGTSSGADSSASDSNDVRGPLDIAQTRLAQDGRSVLLTIRVHGELPPLHALERFPSRVGALDERYLCLQAEGTRIGRRLICASGHVRHSRITLGASSYGKAGATTKRGRIEAPVVKVGRALLELKLPLGQLGPGRLTWATLSGWTSAQCAPTPPTTSGVAGNDRVAVENLCLDRAPNSGFEKLRLSKPHRVGCTRSPRGSITTGNTDRKQLALTFDDGPSSYTAAVLRILDSHGAKGTFFELGASVPGNAAVMKRLIERGHEIGNHSMRHESYPGYASLRTTSARIEAATGFDPCTFRPPGGAVSSSVVGAARAAGMSTVLWDIDPRDWAQPGSGAIYSAVVSRAHPGAIALMHDGGGPRGQTIAALPQIIETLQSRGYRLVTVTELLGERFIWDEGR